jgi:hypothetical protein
MKLVPASSNGKRKAARMPLPLAAKLQKTRIQHGMCSGRAAQRQRFGLAAFRSYAVVSRIGMTPLPAADAACHSGAVRHGRASRALRCRAL